MGKKIFPGMSMEQLKKPFNKIKSIHFVGIKGVGMTPLAIMAKEIGIRVTGSDIGEEFITDWALKKVGIMPLVGFSKDHIGYPDLVITTGAHGGFDNKEVKEARKRRIPVLAQGEAVGFFMKGLPAGGQGSFGISVAGSHGKTTVTAFLATILSENNLSPSYLVGTSSLNGDWLPGHFGRGKYFVTEADEYVNEPKYDKTPKFLYQQPKMIVMTNIDFDHPDQFRSIEEIREAFLKFGQNLPKEGILIANGDSSQIREILLKLSCRVVTYGNGPNNDLRLAKVNQSQDSTYFWVEYQELSLGEFRLSVPGLHNVLNAVSVIAACIELGISVPDIKKTLPVFTGTKRRFEFIEEKKGILFYDDYAHHPTEIKATLKTAKALFPKKKIICIFQPHTYSRTRALFDEFLHAFVDAQEVIIIDIYPSLREEPDATVSSQKLVNKMSSFHPNAKLLPRARDVIKYINQKINSGELKDALVMTMGAGDVFKISAEILKCKT